MLMSLSGDEAQHQQSCRTSMDDNSSQTRGKYSTISIPRESFSTVGRLVRDLKKLTYQVVSDEKKQLCFFTHTDINISTVCEDCCVVPRLH